MKFKSGVRVKCINPQLCRGSLSHGSVYVVLEVFVYQGEVFLQVLDDHGFLWDFPAEAFELMPEDSP